MQYTLYTLKKLYNLHKSNSFYFPPDIQRRVVWSYKKNSIPFLKSLLQGNAVNPIVLVDIHECLTYATQISRIPSDVSYFSELKVKGYRYIVLDGQNRLKHMCSFIDNEYSITGIFADIEGNESLINNEFYKDIDQNLQLSFRLAHVGIAILSEKTLIDLHSVFKAINSGEPLNPMETRNSTPSPIASRIRELAESAVFQKMTSKILTAKKISRIEDISMILKAHLAISPIELKLPHMEHPIRKSNLRDKTLDDFYDIGLNVAEDDVPQYKKTYLIRTEYILKSVASCIAAATNNSEIVSQRQFWGLLYICEKLYVDRYVLYNHKALYNLVKYVDKALRQKSREDQVKDSNLAKQNNSELPKDNNYYWHAASNIKDSTSRMIRRTQLFEAIFDGGYKSLLSKEELSEIGNLDVVFELLTMEEQDSEESLEETA